MKIKKQEIFYILAGIAGLDESVSFILFQFLSVVYAVLTHFFIIINKGSYKALLKLLVIVNTEQPNLILQN